MQSTINISNWKEVDNFFSDILAWYDAGFIPIKEVHSSIVATIKELIKKYLVTSESCSNRTLSYMGDKVMLALDPQLKRE